MKDETRIRNAAGRKVLADPRTHRYYLCLNDSTYSGAYPFTFRQLIRV